VGDAVGGEGRLAFTAASLTGDAARHPNEDAWAADPTRGAFAVCDGVTSSHRPDGSYPPWAGGGRAAWLAAAALTAAPPGEGRTALGAALATADRLLGALNRARDDGPIDYLQHDVYNTTAVAALVEDDRATIACLGDAAALLQPADGRSRLLTRFQTAAAERLRDELLRDDGMTDDERALVFRRDLRNRVSAWRGRAGLGFGVLDGSGRYGGLVEWVELPLRVGDRLYLVSDTTGHCLAGVAAAGRALPPSAAGAVALARAWEAERAAPYHDDLTALVVERLA
jgi:serine/threonine protein phosphatase PrpC